MGIALSSERGEGPRGDDLSDNSPVETARRCRGAVELSTTDNAVLLKAFESRVARYADLGGEALLDAMGRGAVSPDGLGGLREAFAQGVCGSRELARVAAYADFAREVLGFEGRLPLEVRVEAWKAYALVGIEATLLHSMEGKSLVWVHNEAWAKERFQDGGARLGLLGQFPGKSKFVSPVAGVPPWTTKDAALDALGLRGYAAFDQPGPLFVVIASALPEAILAQAAPALPLLYQVGKSDDPAASVPSSWAPELHFQEGSVPGFTSGLKAELCMQTIQLEGVTDAADVEAAGVTCRQLGGGGS